MTKKLNKNRIEKFFEENKKNIIIFNIIIWTTCFLITLSYIDQTSNQISREEMKIKIEEKCHNNISIPESRYKVKFTTNGINNITTCEVITNGE